jgi:hypothetical protein
MEHKAVCHTTSEKEACVRIYEQVFGWYAGLDSRPSCLTSRGAREGERVTSDESLAPLESIKPDNYPRLSREGLRALKFNWRTANVKDGQRVAACRMPGTV